MSETSHDLWMSQRAVALARLCADAAEAAAVTFDTLERLLLRAAD